MKIYCFQPRGHGEQSAFVVAESEVDARRLVREAAVVEAETGGYSVDLTGFDTDYYRVTVADSGQVIFNDND